MYFFVYLITLFGLASSQCYAPDGTPSNSSYLPCISTIGIHSMCCFLNTTTLDESGQSANIDSCLPSGQCSNPTSTYSRDFCTDKTWKSPNCLKVCTGGASGGNASSLSPMTLCVDGSWCCGVTCCFQNLGFKLASTIAPYTTQSDEKNWLGICLGIALGIILLVDAAVGSIMWKWYRKGTRESNNREETERSNEASLSNNQSCIVLSHQSRVYEAPDGTELVELDGEYKRVSTALECKSKEVV